MIDGHSQRPRKNEEPLRRYTRECVDVLKNRDFSDDLANYVDAPRLFGRTTYVELPSAFFEVENCFTFAAASAVFHGATMEKAHGEEENERKERDGFVDAFDNPLIETDTPSKVRRNHQGIEHGDDHQR